MSALINSALSHQPLFNAVGCLCVVDSKILFLQRRPEKAHPMCWCVPGGKVEPGETRLKAAIRELFEETGILKSAENLTHCGTYLVEADELCFSYDLYLCKLPQLPQVDINSREHLRYGWFSFEQIVQTKLVPGMTEILRIVHPTYIRSAAQLELFPSILDLERSQTGQLDEMVLRKIGNPNGRPITEGPLVWYAAYGPPAAGKSTALRLMAKRDPAFTKRDEQVLARNSSLDYYLHKAFEDNLHEYFFRFQMEILPIRFWQAQNAPERSLVDETIFSTLAYSKALARLGWISDREYRTFRMNYDIYARALTHPARIWFFQCDTNVLLDRIEKRGRKIEKFYTRSYIEALQMAFEEVAIELEKTSLVERINTRNTKAKDIAQAHAPNS